MNTPLIWILLPGSSAIVFYFLRKREQTTMVSGILLSSLLAILGWQIPIGERISLGPLSFELGDTLSVLGRHFTLGASDRPVFVLIYLAVAFWFIGSAVARVNRLFVPITLGIAALLTGALAVEPFLYAALLIEMAVLLSLPLFVPPGKSVSRGTLRYLVYQTLGMPFLLLSGWALAGLETNPGDSVLIVRASLLMGLGFAFILGIFPFHTWIPMIAEEADPYIAAFIFFELPLAISLFGLDFLERYAWLRSATGMYELLRLTGGLMVFFGGLWAAFQTHLGRMMGYAVMVEIGLSLLALGTGAPAGDMNPVLDTFFSLLLPYGLALAVWALALVSIRELAPDLRFRSVTGIAGSLPLASGALSLAHLSMAGFPLLAGFPVQLGLWENLAGQYPLVAIAALTGIGGLMVGGLRTLAVLVMGSTEQEGHPSETWGQASLLSIGMAALLLVGLMPQWFLPFMTSMASEFLQAGP